uniref:AMP-dependent synthetase/ligase domain-containing protein n=1 Tax=Chenopodium quinoa TaxID=63459 RepID=A0A803LUM7_CHEQI
MSGCPSLQVLVPRHVDYLDELRFTAPNIEKLDLKSFYASVLDCPQPEDFKYSSKILTGIDEFDEIVNKICNVEAVKFLEEAFQQSNFREEDIPQTRWKCLHLESSKLNEDQLIGICRVLRSSPYLEELIVFSNSQQNLRRDLGKSRKTREHHVLSEELSSPCVIPLLKSVTIHGHKVPCQGLFQLAEFLLTSCVSLEKIVILPSTYKLGAVEELKFLLDNTAFMGSKSLRLKQLLSKCKGNQWVGDILVAAPLSPSLDFGIHINDGGYSSFAGRCSPTAFDVPTGGEDFTQSFICQPSKEFQTTYELMVKNGDPGPESEWDPIVLNYTSGTMSSPKGVVHCHRGSFITMMDSLVDWSVPKQPVYLWTLPMFHSNGWGFTWGMAAVGGTNLS